MKICMVGLGIGKTHGCFVGGHVNNVINLSKGLAEKGYKIHIVTTPPIHHEASPINYIFNTNIFFHQVDVDGDYINATLGYGIRSIVNLLLEVRALHQKERFDIIHGHSGFALIALIAKISSSIIGIPCIHTLYCPLDDRSLISKLSEFCLGDLDGIVVLSKNTKNSLKNVSVKKLEIIPPLIDASRYNLQITSSLAAKSKEKSPSLLFIGNLTESKGLEILLEAINISKKEVPNIRLLMGIDLPLESFLKKDLPIKHLIKELELEKNVIPLGIIKDLPKAMAASDIFVAPFTSTYGPADYPLSLLEAMASGLPVITTNVGGIPEIVMHGVNGLLIEPNNPLELARSICYLINNKELRISMGKFGAQFVMDLSSDIVKRHECLYGEVSGV